MPLHRLVLALLLIALVPRGARAESLVTVALDVTQVNERDFRTLGLLKLQRKLVLRLTQVGFAVVSVDKQPQIQLLMRVSPVDVELEARAASKTFLLKVALSSDEQESFHLEIIHKAVEITRQARAVVVDLQRLRSRPASQPTSRPTSLPVVKPKRIRPRSAMPARTPSTPWHLDLLLGGAALYRVQGTDPLVRLGCRWGGSRFGLRGAVSLTPSGHEGSGLDVMEWSPQLGASWVAIRAQKLQLEIGLLAGLSQHIFRLVRGEPSAGSRWDFLASVPVELVWQLNRHLGFRFWISPGITDDSRVHKLGDEVVWQRSFFRLESGGGIQVSL